MKLLSGSDLFDGRYLILGKIGGSSFYDDYLVREEKTGLRCRLMLFHRYDQPEMEPSINSMISEFEFCHRYHHPNLLHVYEIIEQVDSFIIVMDYIEGKSLQAVLESEGAQDPKLVVEWAKQLADALGYLHKQTPPVIYRDMKPANVMLKPDGSITLVNFSMARAYKYHSLSDITWLGTKDYAAPEQFGGQGETDARTDIFNLGATMYHLMTGFSFADTNFVIRPIGNLRPELKDTGFEYLVAKCCELRREDRFQSCEELVTVLEHIHEYDKGRSGSRKIRRIFDFFNTNFKKYK